MNAVTNAAAAACTRERIKRVSWPADANEPDVKRKHRENRGVENRRRGGAGGRRRGECELGKMAKL